MPNETSLVAHIRQLADGQVRRRGLGLVQGIGDDCAILRPKAGHDLVFTTDFVLQDRHFTLATHKAADIGHKALARSLSDLAAMGSRPVFCLVSLALPETQGKPFITGFYRGLLALATQHGIALAGGDLASFPSIAADVMCCGEVPGGKALRRSTARAGDLIYVTGSLGASAAGLALGSGRNWRRHLRPEPRVAVGEKLWSFGVRCCMDLSDGLSIDLHRLCRESNASSELSGDLPIAKGATPEQALHGGEDYELLFTASAKLALPDKIAGVPVTCIGRITKGEPGSISLGGKPLPALGFDHFAGANSR